MQGQRKPYCGKERKEEEKRAFLSELKAWNGRKNWEKKPRKHLHKKENVVASREFLGGEEKRHR